jgi:hypothetical protein
MKRNDQNLSSSATTSSCVARPAPEKLPGLRPRPPGLRNNRSVLYQRIPKLFADLALARGDGRYARILRALGSVQLLILDDVDGLSTTAS